MPSKYTPYTCRNLITSPPQAEGRRAYALLLETLKRAGKAGVARVVIHTREYIAIVIPYGKVLALNLMRYEDEIRSAGELGMPEEDLKKLEVTEKELGMAEELVRSMYTRRDPRKYHDAYRENLMEYIHKKVEAGETEKVAEAPAVPEGPR